MILTNKAKMIINRRGSMMPQYCDDFIGKVPQDIYLRTKSFISEQVSVFQPEEYVLGLKTFTRDYHIIILQSTPPLSKLGKKEYQFRKGNFVFLEPGIEFETLPAKVSPEAKYMSISIKKGFFRKVLSEATGKENLKFKKIENTYSWGLLDSVEKLKYELSNYGNKLPTMIQSISTQMIIELLRDINAEGIANPEKTNRDNNHIDKVIDFMKTYYNGNITVEDISRTFHISTCHLQRTFKLHMGQTPYQFLLGIRLEKSKEFLKRDQYSMEEVSRLCGFVSQSHFSKLFRQTTGVSPSEYKKTMKGAVSK